MTETTATEPQPAAPDADARPTRRRRFKQWVLGRDRRELALWIGLIVVAIVVRAIDLGGRAFHHDESQDAYFSYLLFKDFGGYQFDGANDEYVYNPLLHGPLRFYMTALNYRIFGASDFTARLAPAYMGVVAVGLPYLLRHQLGRVAAFGAATVLAIGPTYLYFSRFAREDIYLAAIVLGMIVACFRFIERPRALTLSIVTGLAAASYAMKESGVVMAGLGGLYFLGAIAVQGFRGRRHGRGFWDGEVASAVRAVGWSGWIYAIATLMVVYGALFTRFFTHPDGIDGIYTGLDYWLNQQEVARGDDAAWLYPSIILGEEWPALLLAFLGVFATIRRPNTLRCFLVFYAIGTMGFYCWGSERFAWLVLHPLLPIVLLAGVGLQYLWDLRSRTARMIAGVAVLIGFGYMVAASYSANAEMGTDPRSMLVSTQSSQQVKEVTDQVLALDKEFRRTHGGTPLTISVDSSSGATFPYAWYFRDLSVGYPDLSTATAPPESQILILTEEARATMLPNLAAYEGRRFDFRIWWIKKPYSNSPGEWLDYITQRKPWSPTGGLQESFYVRRDAGDLPGKGTKSEIPPPAK